MYVYKCLDYDQVHRNWLARKPEGYDNYKKEENALYAWEFYKADGTMYPDSYYESHEADWADFKRRWSGLIPVFKRWERSEPRVEVITLDPGKSVHVDVVTGPITARKLLLSVQVKRKIPDKVVMDVINKWSKKHRNMGPYYHALKINVYPDNMDCWETNFKTMEVDLWQKVEVNIAEMVAAARTPAQLLRIYRY